MWDSVDITKYKLYITKSVLIDFGPYICKYQLITPQGNTQIISDAISVEIKCAIFHIY